MSERPPNYNWLSDDDFAKLRFRTRASFAKILSGLRKMYGQANEVDSALEALLFVVEDTWDVVRGRDKIIALPAFFNRYDDDKYRADD